MILKSVQNLSLKTLNQFFLLGLRKRTSRRLRGWFKEFSDIFFEETEALIKSREYLNIKQRSVFSDEVVCEKLGFLHSLSYFVLILCPVEKAIKNVAIICIKYIFTKTHKLGKIDRG